MAFAVEAADSRIAVVMLIEGSNMDGLYALDGYGIEYDSIGTGAYG